MNATVTATAATTANITAALAALAGRLVTITTVIRYIQVTAERDGMDVVSYHPVHRATTGVITSIDTHAEHVTVQLTPDEHWDGTSYLGSGATVTLRGSDHAICAGTEFEVTTH